MNDPKQEPPTATWIGWYVILSYLLYWPAFWGMRWGAEWHASRHPGFFYEIGEPQLWAFLWFFAPVSTLPLLLGNLVYWVLGPVLDLIVRVFW